MFFSHRLIRLWRKSGIQGLRIDLLKYSPLYFKEGLGELKKDIISNYLK
jgi:hypothetical protein